MAVAENKLVKERADLYQKQFIYIAEVVVPFLKNNGSKRLSQSTFEYYKRFSILKPDSDEVIISVNNQDGIVNALSCAVIRNEKEVLYSITVTERSYRQKGHGTDVLKAKLKQLEARGLNLMTLVAEDNEAAIKLCERVGMKSNDKIRRMRSTGFYDALVYKSGE